MPGKVSCFNCYNETINQLNVNGLSIGSTIGGWSTATDATAYTPVAARVPRARHGDGQTTAVFPNDMSTPIRIDWDTFTVQTSISLVGLPNVSLDDDLILYLAVNQMSLMTTRGFVLMTVSYSPATKSAAGEAFLKSLAHPTFHK